MILRWYDVGMLRNGIEPIDVGITGGRGSLYMFKNHKSIYAKINHVSTIILKEYIYIYVYIYNIHIYTICIIYIYIQYVYIYIYNMYIYIFTYVHTCIEWSF